MQRFFGSRKVAPLNPLIEIINSSEEDEEKNLKKLLEIIDQRLFEDYFENLKSDDRNKMNAKLALLNRMMEEEERFSDVKNNIYMKNKYSPPLTRKTKGGKRSHTKKHKHKRHTKKQKHKRTHRR